MMYDLTVVSRPRFSHVKRTDNINSENIKEKSAITTVDTFLRGTSLLSYSNLTMTLL